MQKVIDEIPMATADEAMDTEGWEDPPTDNAQQEPSASKSTDANLSSLWPYSSQRKQGST